MCDKVPENEIARRPVEAKTARSVEHTLIMRHAHDDPICRAPDFLNGSQHATPHGLLNMPSARSNHLIMSRLIVDLASAEYGGDLNVP
jgi:hypothetical protein